MSDLPDLREQIAALFRSAPGETRLGDEPPGLIADAVLGVLPEGWDRFVRTIELLRDRLAETTRERDTARADYSQLAREARDEIDAATREVSRLRREVEFEANGRPLVDWGYASIRDNLRFPLCACPTEQQVADLAGTGFLLPQCSVHPEGGGS